MSWKEILKKYEDRKLWDDAIDFMNEIIKNNPEDPEPYIFMIYFMFNLLMEEMYNFSKTDYYYILAKHYFKESFPKFNDRADYLYLVGRFVDLTHWVFGAEEDEGNLMMEKAHALEPDNVIWAQPYIWNLMKEKPGDPYLIEYAQQVLEHNASYRKYLAKKGAVGQYVLESLEGTARRIMRRFNDDGVFSRHECDNCSPSQPLDQS